MPILILLLLAALSILYFAMRNGIGPVWTSSKVKEALFANFPEVKGPVVELGAGWGTLLIPIALQVPQYQLVGYENSWVPFLFLKARAWKKPNVCVSRRDFWKVDLRGSRCVVCYLYRGAMERLKDKLERELEAGALVVTHTFAIPGWTPTRICRANDLYNTPIYYYITKNYLDYYSPIL